MATKKLKIIKSTLGSKTGLRKHERYYSKGDIFEVPSEFMNERLAKIMTDGECAEYTTAKPTQTGKAKPLTPKELEEAEKKHQAETEKKAIRPEENK